MTSYVTRRNILRIAGGSALGILCTPLPWKLLDDTAIWTQNWSLIPRLPRGPIRYQHTSCSLCSGGCAMRARCVGNYPVSLSGVPGHPLSHGVVCPVGLASHHLAFHPRRVTHPLKLEHGRVATTSTPISFDQVLREITTFIKSTHSTKSIAILDQHPGRSLSRLYRHFARNIAHGIYVVPSSRECRTIATLRSQFEQDPGPMGFDFENAATVLSFGAPLLDGWGTPGRMLNVFNRPPGSGPKLIQIESVQSRTALQSHQWIPITPCSEEILALGLAHLLLAEGLYAKDIKKKALDFQLFRELVSEFSPSVVSARTGVDQSQLHSLVHDLALRGPSISIAGCDPGGGPIGRNAEHAISILNLLLGSVGHAGGIITRKDDISQNDLSAPLLDISDLPDNSIRLLIVDESHGAFSCPWSLIQRKLVKEETLIVCLTTHRGGIAEQADYVIPTPGVFESLRDVRNSPDAGTQTYALATPLLKESMTGVDQFELITALERSLGMTNFSTGSYEELLKQEVQTIFESRRGNLYSPLNKTLAPVSAAATAKDVWTNLVEGGCWIDDKIKQVSLGKYRLLQPSAHINKPSVSLPQQASSYPLLLIPFGWRGMLTEAEISPLLSKLFQESDLRERAGNAFISSATAATMGVEHGDHAIVRTKSGTMNVLVHIDEKIMPGIILVPVGPTRIGDSWHRQNDDTDILSLCDVKEDGSWRTTPATIKKI